MLINSLFVDYQREVIDGGLYKNSIHKLNGTAPAIGLGALSGRALTYFKATNRLGDVGGQPRIGFESDTVQPDDTYKQELRDCVDWAVEQGLHLLCLPELSVCTEGRTVLKAHLRELGKETGRLRHLTIIVAGSYHVSEIDTRWNEAPVWFVDDDGHVTEFLYRKHEAYQTQIDTNARTSPTLEAVRTYAEKEELLTGPYYHIQEDIGSDNRVLLLNLPIGLVGILICKDFLVPHYYTKYDALEPDYLFIVSMNGRGGEFMNAWQKDAKRHALSAAFYTNATQVIDEKDETTEVIFWGLPDDRERLKERKSRVYFRQVNHITNHREPLPLNGLVRVSLSASPLNYDTAALNLI